MASDSSAVFTQYQMRVRRITGTHAWYYCQTIVERTGAGLLTDVLFAAVLVVRCSERIRYSRRLRNSVINALQASSSTAVDSAYSFVAWNDFAFVFGQAISSLIFKCGGPSLKGRPRRGAHKLKNLGMAAPPRGAEAIFTVQMLEIWGSWETSENFGVPSFSFVVHPSSMKLNLGQGEVSSKPATNKMFVVATFTCIMWYMQ